MGFICDGTHTAAATASAEGGGDMFGGGAVAWVWCHAGDDGLLEFRERPLQVAVCPAGRVEFRQFLCRPDCQGEHAPLHRGAVVASVSPLQLGPQAGALDPPQGQSGSLVVPSVVAVELGAEQLQDLAFTGRHETTGDLQRDVVNFVDGGASPIVQDCGLVVGRSETSDDPIHDAPILRPERGQRDLVEPVGREGSLGRLVVTDIDHEQVASARSSSSTPAQPSTQSCANSSSPAAVTRTPASAGSSTTSASPHSAPPTTLSAGDLAAKPTTRGRLGLTYPGDLPASPVHNTCCDRHDPHLSR